MEAIIEDLKICLEKKEEEIKELQKKIAQNDQPQPKGKDLVKFIKSQMPMLSENQILLMTNQKQRVNWTNEELSKGFTSAFFSQRCHNYWINDIQIPLPAIRTLNRYAARMVIAPGILHDVLLMLEGYVAHLPEEERQVVLSFDEMACKALVKYHKGLDQVFGPEKEMQVIMVRGLRSKFKQPIYVNFDTAMTKEILFDAITCLHKIGLNVVAIVSDCGGSNVGLWKHLNITCSRHHTQHFFSHPVTGEKVYLFADTPHMLKLLRNWFLDYGFMLEDGTIIKKEKAYELLHLVKTEISPAFKLSELHFDCKGTKRMNVALAAELFSHTTATCLRRYFPNDVEAIKLADFIEMVNYWFDVMNSYTHKGPWYKRAYGLELKHQDKVLNEMFCTVQKMKCYDSENELRGPLQTFQKGILLSIKSIQGLYRDLKTEQNFMFILTHRLNQDCLENFFSQVRGNKRFKEHPNTVECLYNIRSIILGRNPTVTKQLHGNTIDKLPDEYVTSEFCKIASTTKQCIQDGGVIENDDNDIDLCNEDEEQLEFFEECGTMSSEDGIEYIAGWIQKKLKYGDPAASRAKKIENTASPTTSFVSAVSQGGLTKPDDIILNMVENMENEFFKIHGKTFTKQPNIRLNLVSVIKQKYPDIPNDIVNLFARSRIYFRCNYLNKVAHDAAITARIEKRKAKMRAIEDAKLKALENSMPVEDYTAIDLNEDDLNKSTTGKTKPCKKRTNLSQKKSLKKFKENEPLDIHTLKLPGKKSSKQVLTISNDPLSLIDTNCFEESRKRTSDIPVHLLENCDVDTDLERKRQRKMQKFLT